MYQLLPPLLLPLAAILGFSNGQEVDCSRPPPGWPQRPPQCCDLPFPLEDMKKSFGNCIRQIARPTSAVPTPKSVRDTRLCLEECVYKGVGFIKDGATELEKDTIENKLKSSVSNAPSWEKGVAASLETCFDENKSAEVSSEESSCTSAPHDLTHCLLRNLFLNCPADLWNASEECEVVKSRMKDCPDLPPPPPPPPQRFQRPPPF
uniref:Odorant-binding protein 1 n=1 Tax=Tropidothorax elegans TaxID=2233830 RepID=A0A2Z5EMC1_9HEMI|nr:odorant-binding protein 1 [Tropidothorax elegans]